MEGRWESEDNNSYYFEIQGPTTFNLPHPNINYTLTTVKDGVFLVVDAEDNCHVPFFSFSIIDKDTVSVYCYEDENTYTLYRQ